MKPLRPFGAPRRTDGTVDVAVLCRALDERYNAQLPAESRKPRDIRKAS